MNITDFDYQLPKELIAQYPVKSRDESRLLVIERKSGRLRDYCFRDIVDFFTQGDALVLNDAKVKPARLRARLKDKLIDILLVERIEKNLYTFKAKPANKLKPGVKINFENTDVIAGCVANDKAEGNGRLLLQFESREDVESTLDEIGLMPLPPYIKRKVEKDDADRYQTIYARNMGAIAAPTAGLHFTGKVLEEFARRKVKTIYLTLDVGLGTFSPIRENDFAKHKMHKEKYNLPLDSAGEIENVKAASKRICAIGTTSCRVLESCVIVDKAGFSLKSGEGSTDLFIYPPYAFKATDVLLTNFHLPRTTLLLLVCAFAGKELMLKVYNEAVKRKYRFYSYGDCMLII